MSVERKDFGIFMAPFHRVGENPTLSLERNIELIQWLDDLGYDEAWIGEHHSAGWEIIASPEVFMATVAERTRHIRLGTGVISLPYHHPLMVANRMVLLDHLTRGRAMLGIGPGALVSDAHMLGIEPTRQREMMDESMGVIMRLFQETEPFTHVSDWFELHDAVLHLRPYQRPHMPIAVAAAQSPSGPQVAGKYGAGLLSLSVPRQEYGKVTLADVWGITEDAAAESGAIVSRDDWRLVMPVYLAESRQEAFREARKGAAIWLTEYFHETLGQPLPDASPERIIDEMVDRGVWIVGSPDDCIARMEQLEAASGGYGGLLVTVAEWTSREKMLHSYELLARYVAPHFQGSLTGLETSRDWARDNVQLLDDMRKGSIKKARSDYQERRGAAARI